MCGSFGSAREPRKAVSQSRDKNRRSVVDITRVPECSACRRRCSPLLLPSSHVVAVVTVIMQLPNNT